MSQIPITREYKAAVGNDFAQVENRSLLLEKFAQPKCWFDEPKDNSASLNSLKRIAGTNNKKQFQKIDALRQKYSLDFVKLLQQSYGDRLVVVYGTLAGRLAINLAEGVIQNAGISLDRVFGLPLIPGSAVKGVTRNAAYWDCQEHSDKKPLFNRVFGTLEDDKAQTIDQAGAITFLPATPLTESKIVVDITNVHYPDYYRQKERVAKTEKPQPNYFPVVEKGTEFAFPILLNGLDPDPELLKTAQAWLIAALTEHGVGAKTSAGYGWFTVNTEKAQAIQQELVAETAAADPAWQAQLEAMSPEELRSLAKRFKFASNFPKSGPESLGGNQRLLLDKLLQIASPVDAEKKAIRNLKEKFGIE